jgi:hypothetical protein
LNSRPVEEIDIIRQRYTQPTAYGGGVSEITPINYLAVDPSTASGIVGDMSDPRKASFRWGDPEVENALRSMAETEEEAVRILANIPPNTPMYKYKSEQLA